MFRFTEGRWAGQKIELLPWQIDIIGALLDTKDADGIRQYRKALIGCARKSGKSVWLALLALYFLLVESHVDRGAQVFACAGDKDQARIIFTGAQKLLATAPQLMAECEMYRDAITYRQTDSVFRVLSADAPTKHGLSPSFVAFDELHVQPDRDLWDVMTTGQGARLQPLIAAITTAGTLTQSICRELYEYGVQVESGIVTDPAFYFKWYAAPESADWRSPEAWKLANPSLGEITSLAYLESEAREAEGLPGRQATFRQLYLNQWVAVAQRWLDLEVWDEQASEACHA